MRTLRIQELFKAIDPLAARTALDHPEHFVLLDSNGPAAELSRWSFLCGDPFLAFRIKRRRAFVGPLGDEQEVSGDPLEILAGLMTQHRATTSQWQPGLPPLLGGAVGYLGYELLYLIEPSVPDTGRDDLDVPDAYLLFCGTIIATDRVAGRSWLMTWAEDDTSLQRIAARLKTIEAPLRCEHSAPPRERLTEDALRAAGFTPVVSRDTYLRTVERAREHILDGDIFEVCTSQRFDARWSGGGEALYRALREVNPCAFGAWVRLPGVEILSSSPERFVRLDREGWVETRPIKGTRPRGATPEEDALNAAALASSPKDRAENLMIVDLARNDLGRVCRFGTVRAPKLLEVEAHPFTHQLVSTVVGQLLPDRTPVDLIRAAFPGGSITGAPKVEAMTVIDRLEPVKRGPFCGSIGYLDFEGAMDLSIVIRTFVRAGDRLTFHVGGAVVSDSDPADEYQETLDKAHALVAAFQRAAG